MALCWHYSLTVELYDYQRKELCLIGIKADLTRAPLGILYINKGLVNQDSSCDSRIKFHPILNPLAILPSGTALSQSEIRSNLP